MDLTEEKLQTINTYCQLKTPTNKDTEAYMFLLWSDIKPALTKSPFLRLLEHGQGKDGYWTYNHMVLQIEDVLYSMTTLFPDPGNPSRCIYDLGFELDHSSGYEKYREGGLSCMSSILNLGHGGQQRKMRETLLDDDTCVGQIRHSMALKVKDKQVMIFVEGDLPPVHDPDCPMNDTPLECLKKNLWWLQNYKHP
jgi:hypothetical protein